MVIDYECLNIQISNEKSHNSSERNNCVIDYSIIVIDYQWEFSNITPNSHIFLLPKKSYPLKRLREFFWTEMSYPLKKDSLVKHFCIQQRILIDLQL